MAPAGNLPAIRAECLSGRAAPGRSSPVARLGVRLGSAYASRKVNEEAFDLSCPSRSPIPSLPLRRTLPAPLVHVCRLSAQSHSDNHQACRIARSRGLSFSQQPPRGRGQLVRQHRAGAQRQGHGQRTAGLCAGRGRHTALREGTGAQVFTGRLDQAQHGARRARRTHKSNLLARSARRGFLAHAVLASIRVLTSSSSWPGSTKNRSSVPRKCGWLWSVPKVRPTC